MKNINFIAILLVILLTTFSCTKSEEILTLDDEIDYFDISDKPKHKWNELDSLCDSIYKAYGVKVIYEFTPRLIRTGAAFYYPPNYHNALEYTRLMVAKFWLDPVKKNFPKYLNTEMPREYILMGGSYHGTQVNIGESSGAGFNGQFYRLGMGSVNLFNKSDRAWLYNHLVILWHEHAHNQDQKYGRGETFDKISAGTYYAEAWTTKSDPDANKDGFFRKYGGFAPEEDFATTVEHITRFSKSSVETFITQSEKLKTKYLYLSKFYNDKGMDLHRLHELCDSVVNKTNY